MRVGIVGLGLIGGSLGLALRAKGFEVFGVSRQPSTCATAIAKGAADQASTNLTLLAETDIIFVCTPIAVIAPTIKQLIPHLKAKTVITDVGSVKQSIVQDCSLLWHNFVGSHPMAGTEASGIAAAKADLFTATPYVITPTADTPNSAIEKVKQIARSLNTKIYTCTPAEHDQAVAFISHLPVMLSGSLIQTCLAETNPKIVKLAKKLASSGFRDTSRVGGGNPELGLMMAKYNRPALLRSLSLYRHNLEKITQYIEQADWESLSETLATNQAKRSEFID
ncbi:MAG: prephenate/arogenate dehydrogenase [Cyanobacteria bacterium J083]|nr:MAG: prephenate/arogenate dehydrogenase [Cyanobacteria bacterium J083]